MQGCWREEGKLDMNNVLNAKNGHIKLRSFEMDYIRFGNGGRTLVMIPGVGDGLRTVKGMAIPFSVLYRSLASDFTVYEIGRASCRERV